MTPQELKRKLKKDGIKIHHVYRKVRRIVGVTYPTFTQWLSGDAIPDPKIWERVERELR